MANTYTQLYIHVIFAVQNRTFLISETWESQLYKNITSITENNGHKMLAIGGMNDHIHLFIGINPNESLSHLIQEIKRDSSSWINKKRFITGSFSWQKGYGAFSYSRSQIDNVINYISCQKEHHKKDSFKNEYIKMLDIFGIKYDEQYLFNFK